MSQQEQTTAPGSTQQGVDPTKEGSVTKPGVAGAVTGAVAGATVAGAVTGGLAAPVGAVAGGMLGHAVGGMAGAEATASGEAGDVEVVPAPGTGAAAAGDTTLPKVEEKRE